MSSFDPYHKWLGIPKSEQPPHHYRLLGTAPFETDPEVIEAAADRQMAYIRQCATGPYTKESQQILNELSAARVCLLNAAKKQTYDRELKARVAPPASAHSSSNEADEARDSALLLLEQSVAEKSGAPSHRQSRKKTSGLNAYWLYGGGGGLGLLLLWAFVHMLGQERERQQPAKQTTVAETPDTQARDSKKDRPTRRRSPEGASKPTETAPSIPVTASSPTSDLLKQISLQQNSIRGTWRFDGATLVSSGESMALLQIPVTPPENYILRATIEAATIQDGLCLGLVVGPTQGTVVLNGWNNSTSGLQWIDSKWALENETRTGPVLVSGAPNQIVCTVVGNRIEATCNGK
jgi:hypothetical protein